MSNVVYIGHARRLGDPRAQAPDPDESRSKAGVLLGLVVFVVAILMTLRYLMAPATMEPVTSAAPLGGEQVLTEGEAPAP